MTAQILSCKTCSKCKEIKSLEQFSPHNSSADGLMKMCRVCLHAVKSLPRIENPIDKKCARCQIVKLREEFPVRKKNRDGLYNYCKECANSDSNKRRANRSDEQREYENEYLKEYYRANMELMKQRAHDWRVENPSRFQQANRRYYSLNKENCKNKSHVWYQKNPERCRVNRRMYKVANREIVRSCNRGYNHNRRARILSSGGSHTREQWTSLCELYGYRCLACGEKKTLTVDHVIPISKGGSNDISNIQPLCMKCNQKKHARIIDYR